MKKDQNSRYLCLLIYFLFVLVSCDGDGTAKTYEGEKISEKINLDLNEIDSITLIQSSETSIETSQKLSKEQIKEFVQNLNTAKYIGPYKWISQFVYRIYMDSGVIDIRTNGDRYKWKNDHAYQISDKDFFLTVFHD